jgi:hypothetical protein
MFSCGGWCTVAVSSASQFDACWEGCTCLPTVIPCNRPLPTVYASSRAAGTLVTFRMPNAMVYESSDSLAQGSAIASACSQLRPESLPAVQHSMVDARAVSCGCTVPLARSGTMHQSRLQFESTRTEAPCYGSFPALSQHVGIDVRHNDRPLQPLNAQVMFGPPTPLTFIMQLHDTVLDHGSYSLVAHLTDRQ